MTAGTPATLLQAAYDIDDGSRTIFEYEHYSAWAASGEFAISNSLGEAMRYHFPDYSAYSDGGFQSPGPVTVSPPRAIEIPPKAMVNYIAEYKSHSLRQAFYDIEIFDPEVQRYTRYRLYLVDVQSTPEE